jgi:hypothetical protein
MPTEFSNTETRGQANLQQREGFQAHNFMRP